MRCAKGVRAGALLLAAAAGIACSSNHGAGEASTNLVSFASSPCKKESTAAGTASSQQTLAAGLDGDALAGLKCIAWERASGDLLKVDLVNFEGACGAEWTGDAVVMADGTVALKLVNPEGKAAFCGWCLYDWSFEVRGTGSGDKLAISISIDTQPGSQPIEGYQATLPVSSSGQGVSCRYASYEALGSQAAAANTCGTVGMPCLGTSMCSASAGPRSCSQGLVCDTNGTADQYVCLAPCSADADCPSGGALSCQTGLCRPTNPW